MKTLGKKNREYGYNIITFFSKVLAEIYYKDYVSGIGDTQIFVCKKGFERPCGGFFATIFYDSPTEEQYIKAEKWAKKQLEMTIKYQK
jgi:hypothetical protein